ncbi:MAG: MATE family efflux transporter [Lachnospiraceae bacterium]
MQDKTQQIFRDAPVPKAVLTNVIPSVISMLMVLVYNLADTFFIGQTKNPLMVAAVSVATPAFLLFMAIGMLFGIGGTSLISRMLGEGKKDTAKHASSFCFWTSLSIGVVSMVIILVFCEPVCRMIGASDDTIGYATQYLSILSFGIPFLIISNAFSNIIRSEGQANKAMLGMIVGNLINIVLDPVMILGLKWNVAGAAIATVLGNVCSAVIYVSHLASKKSLLSIRLKDYSAGGNIAAGIFAIGIPASLNSVLMSVSNIVINKCMSEHGDLQVAGLGVAMKVNMIAVMLLIGVGTGIQPLLGYCYGAGNRKRYKSVLLFSLGLAFSLSCVMTAICYMGAAPLARAFLENEEAFNYAFAFSRTYIMSGPILGILFVFMNAIQSMGAALPSLILSISRQGIIYFPILFTIRAISNTPQHLAMTQPLTDYIAAGLSVILFIIAYRRYFIKNQQDV